MMLLLFSFTAFVAATLNDEPKRYCEDQLRSTLSLHCSDRYESENDESFFEIEGKYT